MRRSGCLALLLLWACCPRIAAAQTPSPLAEWQYSGGIILAQLFQPDQPDWRIVLGLAADVAPEYDGARAYKTQVGPVINIRYKDEYFASTGEGLGINFLHGDHYRVGAVVGYDLGRKVRDDYEHLHGLNDIEPAPFLKLFGSYVISKEFPLVLRAAVREVVGGADGLVADLGAYLPLPGSSKKLVMFAGPSMTFIDRRYAQNVFGISPAQAMTSGYPEYDAHGGGNAAGLGFSATRFVSDHWLINADGAMNHLLGSANRSPITQSTTQRVLALSAAYTW